jgi:hypothetical protein
MSTAETTGSTVPLTEREQRIWAEIEWAEQNAELRARYVGHWVVLAGHKVLAYGPDRGEALRAASLVSGQPGEELAAWFVAEAAALLSDYPPDAGEA